jgi:pantoate--beta-alanine ligase
MAHVIKSINELKSWRANLPAHLKVGFVPTMGALHAGHAELLRAARENCDIVVLSIYVNQTQFNNPEDFSKYPNTWEQDLELARKLNADMVFSPSYEEMYPDGYKYKVVEIEKSGVLCGKYRPGHFDGVLSVVMKLFQLVKPHRAYFGEKDHQQLTLIKGMVEAFFLDMEIVAIPTQREVDGLAMSSRNLRLSSEDRAKAPWLYKIIREAKAIDKARQQLEDLGFQVDYIEDLGSRRYVAAFLGSVRLIDNVEI